MAIVSQPYSDLELDQQAMLYPMLGYLHRDRNLWRVLAQGRFYRHVPIETSADAWPAARDECPTRGV